MQNLYYGTERVLGPILQHVLGPITQYVLGPITQRVGERTVLPEVESIFPGSLCLQNVVWEKLDDLMGNTQFLKADFTPYGSNSLAEQVSDAADLVQAALAGVGPNKSQATDGTHSPVCSVVCLIVY